MTLAEKLAEVGNNRPKLYNKGALDYSPQETVSGEAIGITDISPIEHNMGVSVRGKNLAQYTIYSGGKELVAGASYAETNFQLSNKLPANTPLYFAVFTDDGVMVSTSGVSRTLRQKNYQVSGELQKDVSSNTKTYTLTEDEANVARYVYVYMSGTVVNTYAGKTINKLVISTEPITEYAPYIEDISTVKLFKSGEGVEPIMYDVQADGTVEGVKSLYPSTSLYTDTQGAVIDCTYYQDGKKVKENLIDMILELGGVINE